MKLYLLMNESTKWQIHTIEERKIKNESALKVSDSCNYELKQ